MKLVQDWPDIRRNLLTLDGYRTSSDPISREFFETTIRQGHCFVCCRVAGRQLFGPSRFIGYHRNTRLRHDANTEKHGGVTNYRIAGLLNAPFIRSRSIEAEFGRFCRRHGIEPQLRTRKYIQYDEDIHPDDPDLIHEDLDEIRKDKTLGTTEKKRLTMARIGQGDFRRRVLGYWRHCPVTGCGLQCLLRASHIKPWRDSTNSERLDPWNGLLLAPQIDAAFDKGLISFDSHGNLLLSRNFPRSEARKLGIHTRLRISISTKHDRYLRFHRERFGH